MKLIQPLNTTGAAACLTVSIVLVTYAEAGAVSELAPSKTVTGEVSKVEGEFHMAKDRRGEDTLKIVDKSYVITNQDGEELRLELSEDTKIRNRVNPGDKIEAKISSEGHTLSVTRLK
ncbi:MAG TPA: hypothetical protein VF819_09320 [Nitrospira sp.]